MTQIHVDIDNLWVLEEEYGVSLHQSRDFIFLHALPIALKLLKKYKQHATFFVIGQDLQLPACQTFCRRAIREGHTIGNHTWSHPVLFGSLNYAEKKAEITKAHNKILTVTGKRPTVFRGPGYFSDDEVLEILHSLRYSFDSSVLPGYAQLLMKCFALIQGGENRAKAFGLPRDIFSSTHPYDRAGLVEQPISVLPLLRLPIHTTFLYAFGPWYRSLVFQYLESKPKDLVYSFHAIDFADLPHREANFPIVPLRVKYTDRLQLVHDILQRLA
jgi:hypothetical protein